MPEVGRKKRKEKVRMSYEITNPKSLEQILRFFHTTKKDSVIVRVGGVTLFIKLLGYKETEQGLYALNPCENYLMKKAVTLQEVEDIVEEKEGERGEAC